MKSIISLAKLTIREAMARKIFLTFAGVSSFILLLFTILFVTTSVDDISSLISVGGNAPFEFEEKLVEIIKYGIVGPLFVGGLFLSIFSVSSFIPNMLEKGNIDLLLSKPISRMQIILGKFLGGFAVVFINIAYLVLGIFVLLGLKFGAWELSFLMTIIMISFTFAVLYSLIILIGILTRSSMLAMMLSYLIFFILSPFLAFRNELSAFLESEITEFFLDLFYYIIPQTQELSIMTMNFARGIGIDSYLPILTSFLFLILTLALSITIFNKKDY